MPDRRTTLLMERLRALAARKERFSYDVRGDSHVNRDIIVAYRMEERSGASPDLEKVIEHAMAHDAIVTGWRDPSDGMVHFSSCRLFTDVANAVRFAREHGQRSVYNWNRDAEVPVNQPPTSTPEDQKERRAS